MQYPGGITNKYTNVTSRQTCEIPMGGKTTTPRSKMQQKANKHTQYPGWRKNNNKKIKKNDKVEN